MELNDYQKQAMTTCLPESENFAYMFMNLVGEVGEFSSKCAKFIRKGKASFNEHNQFCPKGVDEKEREDLRKELGDCLWQLSGLCTVMGWTLEEVAQENLDKLKSRKERGVVDGNGDNR
jgi:NTP pyrophosphatase (non-canonical NTP hydrolase)